MSASLLLSLALTVGQPPEAKVGVIVPPPPPPPPVIVFPPPHPNFVTPGPYFPNLYPVVPQPVVIAHPNWYEYPGPAYWYRNHITPYHLVVHHPMPPPKVKVVEKKEEKKKEEKKKN